METERFSRPRPRVTSTFSKKTTMKKLSPTKESPVKETEKKIEYNVLPEDLVIESFEKETSVKELPEIQRDEKVIESSKKEIKGKKDDKSLTIKKTKSIVIDLDEDEEKIKRPSMKIKTPSVAVPKEIVIIDEEPEPEIVPVKAIRKISLKSKQTPTLIEEDIPVKEMKKLSLKEKEETVEKKSALKIIKEPITKETTLTKMEIEEPITVDTQPMEIVKEIKVLETKPESTSVLERLKKSTSKAKSYNPEASFNKPEVVKKKLETVTEKTLSTVKLPVSKEAKLTITQFLNSIDIGKPSKEEETKKSTISISKMKEKIIKKGKEEESEEEEEEVLVKPKEIKRKPKEITEEVVLVETPIKETTKEKETPKSKPPSSRKKDVDVSEKSALIEELRKNRSMISAESSRSKKFYSQKDLSTFAGKLGLPTAKSKAELVSKILDLLDKEEVVSKD
jgi:hypothetical protein